MQVITVDQLLSALRITHETIQAMFNAIFHAVWQNIMTVIPTLISDISSHNWNGASAHALALVGGIVLLYHLVRRKPLAALTAVTKN
jgi:hypothetical protein